MSKKIPILPPNLMRLLDERMRELWGCVAVIFAMLCAYALWSYSPNNDSLNVVTSTPPSYALKQVCANIADILKQTFGAMSWIFTISIGILGIKTTQSNVLTLRRLFEVFIGASLLCVFIQSCFIQQVTASNLMQPIPTGGVIGFLSTRKILELLRSNDLGKMFVTCMVIFFLIGVMVLKHALGVTIRSISTSIRKITRKIQRVIFRIQTPKPSNEVPTFFKPKEEPSSDESELKPPHQPLRTTRISKDASGYQLPPVELLKLPSDDSTTNTLSKERINEQADKLVEVLSEFGVNGEIVDVQPGPVVTMFEFRPAPGVKTSRIISLSDDIARSMSALSARIANIPGKNAIGIELPNDKRNSVYLRTLLDHAAYRQTNCDLPLILGKNISGAPVVTDLSKMPHLLVAGTTGSGKSVSINTMILSLLYRFSPSECRFIMVDPKMLELFVYNDIPHLLTPVVTEPKKAIFALKWAVREMESRYKAMSLLGVRNIDGFNQKINEGNQKGDVFMRRVQTGFDPETGKPVFEDQPLQYKTFPYIVVVVDEMADLMLVAGKEIEVAVQRLAQMARAAGIHLIMATQRPSVDVITGTIKANFPTRISFQVTSKIDSRTILGEQGAEQLLGHGDMLYMSGGGRILRVHGPFVSDSDVEAVASFIKTQGEPEYIDGVTDEIDDGAELVSEGAGQRDDLFNQAVELIRREGRVSISYIQRNFQIGYNKAAKLVEQMEKEGIVSPPDRTGKREIL
jgi:DNA segregation ATPase FtsK/SpoIIIE-like protein